MENDRPVSVAHIGMAQSFASIFGMRAIEIPAEVIHAERTVSEFFAENNISGWKLGGSAARDLLPDLEAEEGDLPFSWITQHPAVLADATLIDGVRFLIRSYRLVRDNERAARQYQKEAMQRAEKAEEEARSLRNIAAAARNLVAVKGRHNTEIAMQRLIEACKK